MQGILVVNGFLTTSKFTELTELFCDAAKQQGIQLDVYTNIEYFVGYYEQNQAEKLPDFVLFWDKDILLAKYLESISIPVFNCSEGIEICDDKRKTYMALKGGGIPTPYSLIVPMTYENIGYRNISLWDNMGVGNTIAYPLILKEAFGSFGEQVYRVDNREELCKMIQKLDGKPLMIQENIESSYGQDLRLQVVGNQVIAAMRRYSENDFRANITAGGKMEAYQPDEKACTLAIEACKAVKCDFAGVDLLFGKDGEYLVCEVNSNAHFKNLLDCTGINAAEYIIKYIVNEVTKDVDDL